MADSIIGQGCTDGIEDPNLLIVEDGASDSIDINCVEIPAEGIDVTELEIGAPLTNATIGLRGEQDTALVGKKTTNTNIINEAQKGETASIRLANNSNKGLTIRMAGGDDNNASSRGTAVGKGRTELLVTGGKFKQGDVSTAARKAKDTITFGSNTTLTNSSFATGKGKDTITFGGGLKLKKTTTVETGQGKDIVEIGENRVGKGKLLLSDFSKKDRLVVGGRTLKLEDIENGEAPKWVKLDA